ncbi:MAG: PorV/PorQ family protein [bacterium]|nr:PorV/PorQ family protein [bacterium]
MRKRITLLITFGFILGAASTVMADPGKTAAAQFLKFDVAARAAGMGGAFAGVADDASALYYNPAGLGDLIDREALVSYVSLYSELPDPVSLYYLSYVHPTPWASFGGSLTYLGSGDIPGYDDKGIPIQGTTFTIRDLALSFGLGKRVWEDLALGAGLKIISSRIEDASSNIGIALDLGAIYEIPIPGLLLGAAIKNLGTSLKYDDGKSNDLPLMLKTGLSYSIVKTKEQEFRAAIDGNIPKAKDGSTYVSAGLEYWYQRAFGVRIGYNGSASDPGGGLTLGAGFKGANFGLDYAYHFFGDLGDVHRISLLGKF